jgi:hypothetical protein
MLAFAHIHRLIDMYKAALAIHRCCMCKPDKWVSFMSENRNRDLHRPYAICMISQFKCGVRMAARAGRALASPHFAPCGQTLSILTTFHINALCSSRSDRLLRKVHESVVFFGAPSRNLLGELTMLPKLPRLSTNSSLTIDAFGASNPTCPLFNCFCRLCVRATV